MVHRRRLRAAAFIFLIFAVYVGTVLLAGRAGGALGSGQRFDLTLWIARNLSRTWLNQPARSLGGGSKPAADADLAAFFEQASMLAAQERDLAFEDATDHPRGLFDQELQDRLAKTRALSWPAEIRLASDLTRAVSSAGMSTTLPFYHRISVVWPPVSFAYDFPPLVLVRSPRDRIELVDATLLRNDLNSAEISSLELQAEAGGQSALVVRIGGLAAYPSLVEDDDGYGDSLEVIAHEWTHQYLAFHPLGVRYFENLDMTTLNETIANLVSLELVGMMRSANPAPPQLPAAQSIAPSPDSTVDFDRTLHQLRLQVDGLLARGNVTDAEERMDATRQFLAEHGYNVRKINQAYFAFYGTYANTGASSSRLGPDLATLRSRYGSLSSFVHAVQDLRSAADLQRLLRSSAG